MLPSSKCNSLLNIPRIYTVQVTTFVALRTKICVLHSGIIFTQHHHQKKKNLDL